VEDELALIFGGRSHPAVPDVHRVRAATTMPVESWPPSFVWSYLLWLSHDMLEAPPRPLYTNWAQEDALTAAVRSWPEETRRLPRPPQGNERGPSGRSLTGRGKPCRSYSETCGGCSIPDTRGVVAVHEGEAVTKKRRPTPRTVASPKGSIETEIPSALDGLRTLHWRGGPPASNADGKVVVIARLPAGPRESQARVVRPVSAPEGSPAAHPPSVRKVAASGMFASAERTRQGRGA